MKIESTNVWGMGSAETTFSLDQMSEILEVTLAAIDKAERVLAIIPDRTRDDNTHQLLPLAGAILTRIGVAQFDILVAQGTHAPMTEAEKLSKIGVSVVSEMPGLGGIYDHEWDNPGEIICLGTLSPERVFGLTGGLLDHSIDLTINKRISPKYYDRILVFGACAPHEVAGFSGGAKYFFPGVSGADLTNATHWLGALAGIENTIGRVETPARRLIEAAAEMIAPEVTCFISVTARDEGDELRTHALFGGDMKLAFRKAAEISSKVHIKYTDRKYKTVVALLDDHYDELWTGGKASYKLGSIVEEGGELIIYAPHLRCASDTHGATIEKYGYAPIKRVKEMVAVLPDLAKNLCVAAHLAHVAYAGTAGSGGMSPRYQISLASQIDEETCRKLNLKYLDLREFDLENYRNDADVLIVERAGQALYMIKPES